MNRVICIILAMCLSACGTGPRPVLPSGNAAYALIPEGSVTEPRRSTIGPNDTLSVAVFREPDLSLERAIVDSDGLVQVPLLGSIPAAGMTAAEFARDLELRYGDRYLVNPSVTVSIIEASLRQVTVTGAVTKPGVYEVPGRLSLVDAVALAEGPTNVAQYDQVIVFRRIEGQRVGGLFDLGAINAGLAADVEVLPGDQVIVGTDALKQVYRDVLTAAPLISVFQVFR